MRTIVRLNQKASEIDVSEAFVFLLYSSRLIICTEVVLKDDNMNAKSDVWPNGIPSVGQKARRSRLVTARDKELFTEISGDRNPLHYDEEIARNTRFGSIVVQGGIISAILNAVVAEDLPGPGTVFLQVNWNFKAPVRPGDTITGEVEVTKVREDNQSLNC